MSECPICRFGGPPPWPMPSNDEAGFICGEHMAVILANREQMKQPQKQELDEWDNWRPIR